MIGKLEIHKEARNICHYTKIDELTCRYSDL